MKSRSLLLVVSLWLALAPLPAAHAQVPPHMPGTVCATPQFWCWAVYQGPPGSRCACPGPYGMWYQGVLV
jgi:hypothetical protein